MRYGDRLPFDGLTEDGAKHQADLINAYWRERGFEVNAKAHQGEFFAAARATIWCVRSEMLNGQPVAPKPELQPVRRIAA